MAIELSIAGNFFIFTDDVSGSEIFRWPSAALAYQPFPLADQLPADIQADYVVFYDLGTIQRLPGSVTKPSETFEIKGKKFLRTELRDGNAGGLPFADMTGLNQFLEPLIAGFNLAAFSGPGLPISQTSAASFFDGTYTSLNTFLLPGNTDSTLPNDGAITRNPKSIPEKGLVYQANTQLFEYQENDIATLTIIFTAVPAVPNTRLRLYMDIPNAAGYRVFDDTVFFGIPAGAIIQVTRTYSFLAPPEFNLGPGRFRAIPNFDTEAHSFRLHTITSR